MLAPLILLPPSEGKRPGGVRRARRGAFDADLAATRDTVLALLGGVLASSSPLELEAALGVRGPLLDRARASTLAVVTGRAELRPAWQRYSGVVWTHLDPETLSAAQRRRLVVPSGLYGLNAGDDLIADYRLKMSTRLAGRSVASLWRSVMAQSLARHARRRTVYDLLPVEHRSALDAAGLGATRMITVTFRHGGDGRLAGHDAKAAKGAFARHLLDHDAESFSWRGWRARVNEDAIDVLFGP